jgi:hypothetical protein
LITGREVLVVDPADGGGRATALDRGVTVSTSEMASVSSDLFDLEGDARMDDGPAERVSTGAETLEPGLPNNAAHEVGLGLMISGIGLNWSSGLLACSGKWARGVGTGRIETIMLVVLSPKSIEGFVDPAREGCPVPKVARYRVRSVGRK